MKRYIEYMDRQTVSPALHAGLLEMGQRVVPVPRRTRRLPKIAALAACCLLIAGLGVWKLRPGRANDIPELIAPAPVSASPSVTVPPTSYADTAASVGSATADQTGTSVPGGFLADSGSEHGLAEMMFAFPYIPYPDLTDAVRTAGDWDDPDGAYRVELGEEAICAMFWGGPERMVEYRAQGVTGNVPWVLFWDGFRVCGSATYDGTGKLLEVLLTGENEGGESFRIRLAPDAIPTPQTVYSGTLKGEWAGTEYEAWMIRYGSSGALVDTVGPEPAPGRENCFALLSGGVGVRAAFTVPDTAEGELPRLRDALFLTFCCSKDSMLTLEHLLTNDDVPAFRHVIFHSYDEVLREADYAPYLPQTAPEGFVWDEGELRYQEGNYNLLWLRWIRGRSHAEIRMEFPENGDDYGRSPVDAADPAQYDVRLYTIPWSESVPEAYRDDLFCPTFRAEDMCRELVAAREAAGDGGDGGSYYLFRVLYPDGALVSYDCRGLDTDAVWALVRETLP